MNIAVDIGNTRCKFEDGTRSWVLPAGESIPPFAADLPKTEPIRWWIASVHRPTLEAFSAWLMTERPADSLQVLTHTTIPISVQVDFPEKVGVDRLLAATAANARRTAGRPAVVVDLGTALKVDLLDENGVFQGGAIAPGIRMSALALERQTDALPSLDVTPLLDAMRDTPVVPLGKNTDEAMASGLYWGMVGAIRELVYRVTLSCSTPPDQFITGGGAQTLARDLGDRFQYVPEMVLQGIWETISRMTMGNV